MTDDSQIVQAVSQLPSLALPPIGGLLALLGAYILLIGPINYFVLKRLDRREWAWLTMPVLIVAFAVGAYAFGSLLRGSEVIINEVAIVRGAPGATEGTAQAYLGVFSPSRGTYQIKVPGGALLSSPHQRRRLRRRPHRRRRSTCCRAIPARVRDLGVGFGSLRTVRAETAVPVPLVTADIKLASGRLTGTRHQRLDASGCSTPASSSAGPSRRWPTSIRARPRPIDVAIQPFQFGQQLSDRVVGPVFFGDPTQLGDDASTKFARHTIIDQLTYDPNFGFVGQLPADGPVDPGLGRPRPPAGRDRGPGGQAHRATSCTSCRRASGSRARPRSATT